jgi:deoxyribodipyrimidine photo-lyase
LRKNQDLTPKARIRTLNDRPANSRGQYVVYWMTAARRTQWNFGLQRAVERAVEFQRPLVVLEALRCDYAWASDRVHQFILDGMADNARRFARAAVLYYPFVEHTRGQGRGLLRALASHASIVVTDWSPAFFLPHMLAAGAAQVGVLMEAVDSNGIIPIAAAGRAFPTARSYRAFVQRELREHLLDIPDEEPLSRLRRHVRMSALPDAVTSRWPAAPEALLGGGTTALAGLPIDHRVAPVPTRGGSTPANRALRKFVDDRLERYADDHNHPDIDGTSRLSPYLHVGHISAHQIFSAVMTHERWTTRKLAKRAGGIRENWWGTSPSAEMFLDQLLVWREVAFNGCEWWPHFTEYESLPAWARATLAAHASDPRPHQYSMAALESATTHDEVWNAAQRQMMLDGWAHGYMRMVWGKKIYEWSRDPVEALARMETLMNRYSLDGRDPVSSASFTWVLGRYDRPWPERPIFGTVRSMTSESARKKLKMRKWLERYGARG